MVVRTEVAPLLREYWPDNADKAESLIADQGPAGVNIPIRNIYFLLVYAWDVLDEADAVDLDASECTNLLDLFARLLVSGLAMVRRRGLDRGYIAHRDAIAGIRGKLELSASIKARSFGAAGRLPASPIVSASFPSRTSRAAAPIRPGVGTAHRRRTRSRGGSC